MLGKNMVLKKKSSLVAKKWLTLTLLSSKEGYELGNIGGKCIW